MRLLADTHTFLWMVEGNPHLSLKAREALENPENETWLSLVSVWEMAIKISTGKLSLNQPLETYITEQTAVNGIQLLPLSLQYVLSVESLPFHHRDPFDRLLVAQATVESMPLISADQIFDEYGIVRLW